MSSECSILSTVALKPTNHRPVDSEDGLVPIDLPAAPCTKQAGVARDDRARPEHACLPCPCERREAESARLCRRARQCFVSPQEVFAPAGAQQATARSTGVKRHGPLLPRARASEERPPAALPLPQPLPLESPHAFSGMREVTLDVCHE
eukprot:CAMPEP_0119361914 /NCGR_PEP_ID=MMETSP1334-20130426/9119_1 /TAXON_ID=127549 /ORGANISM="Calcidiscus leptoporus, Strain RCC1130" /LENGTH=148 /DNA_ID=CAMNT_0007377043 /DNA_START=1542 /DNA_END=1988 /DNA_ORIENTATION=-